MPNLYEVFSAAQAEHEELIDNKRTRINPVLENISTGEMTVEKRVFERNLQAIIDWSTCSLRQYVEDIQGSENKL